MNGAAFFLAVNFIIAMSFALAFAVVSTRSRSRASALWFAAAFAIASLSALCELLVAYAHPAKFWAIGAFATVLAGMILLRVGIGELYGRKIDPRKAVCFLLGGIFLDLLIYDLPRGTALHAFSYQTPFALVIFASAVAVLSSTRRLMIDRALGGLLLVTCLHFFAKAGLAILVGAGTTAKDYIHTNYGLISQSSTAVLMVAVGLTLLSVLVLEIMADERSNAEKDSLSGLANRLGFENGVKAAMTLAPNERHALILCDLDHFKRINDTFGHHVGDLVIQAFGDLLRANTENSAVVGRIGGEEFAVFMPNTTSEIAALFAQLLRGEVTEIALSELPSSFTVMASFGVAEFAPGEKLASVMRTADAALYEAKRSGRNCVKQARTRGTEPAAIKIMK